MDLQGFGSTGFGFQATPGELDQERHLDVAGAIDASDARSPERKILKQCVYH